MADRDEAKGFIARALELQGSNEAVMRHNLSSYLPRMFNPAPWWVDEHVSGSEYSVRYHEPDGTHRGQVDVVVGRTPIEYESDLRVAAKFEEGHRQIRQYLAGMANDGHPVEQLRGIVSDTVRWYAYRPVVDENAVWPKLGESDISLELIEPPLDITGATDANADRLIGFLEQHLGREGSRPLSAQSLAGTLGRGSASGDAHRAALLTVVERALTDRPEYGALIEQLWTKFIAYPGAGGFDAATYADELYLVTLAKLVCANVIEGRALRSDHTELVRIINGTWFRQRGLDNFVEHDFFGWLDSPPFDVDVVSVAEQIQVDLLASDFSTPATQDLFGELFAQMASAAERLLLGQEWTPQWLARQVVSDVVATMGGTAPRFVDMCCGSGAFVVAAVEQAVARLAGAGRGPDDAEALQSLLESITAFDIDPLAVILARVNWVIAARPWLGNLDGSRRLPIPVYQADSLFVVTGLQGSDVHPDHYELHLLDRTLYLPKVLAVPPRQAFFDEVVAAAHRIAAARAGAGQATQPGDSAAAIQAAAGYLNEAFDAHEEPVILAFVDSLIDAIRDAESRGLNGLWSFVLRNNYRPALVRGQFNGLVSNPPWLAMSKLPDNPYKAEIDEKMTTYGVRPSAAAHPHAELATVFLMEAVERYLEPAAQVGCVLPGTVVNGAQHNNFRRKVGTGEPLAVTKLWQVAGGVFKNRAIVFFGVKQ